MGHVRQASSRSYDDVALALTQLCKRSTHKAYRVCETDDWLGIALLVFDTNIAGEADIDERLEDACDVEGAAADFDG